MAATRLPNKPLLRINNKTLIMNVYEKAKLSNVGEVYVATCDDEIFDEVTANGGKCLKTDASHQTGTDRIFEAFKKLDLKNIHYVINLQGDEPLIDINDIQNLKIKTNKNNSDMATLACKIDDDKIFENENIVKVITNKKIDKNNTSKAITFSRKIKNNDKKNIYQHIGIYIYKPSVLKKFVQLQQTKSEKRERLEQLRALQNNIEIDVVFANSKPIGVDTKKDYIEIKKLIEYKK